MPTSNNTMQRRWKPEQGYSFTNHSKKETRSCTAQHKPRCCTEILCQRTRQWVKTSNIFMKYYFPQKLQRCILESCTEQLRDPGPLSPWNCSLFTSTSQCQMLYSISPPKAAPWGMNHCPVWKMRSWSLKRSQMAYPSSGAIRWGTRTQFLSSPRGGTLKEHVSNNPLWRTFQNSNLLVLWWRICLRKNY